jgi:hypothetical protein
MSFGHRTRLLAASAARFAGMTLAVGAAIGIARELPAIVRYVRMRFIAKNERAPLIVDTSEERQSYAQIPRRAHNGAAYRHFDRL